MASILLNNWNLTLLRQTFLAAGQSLSALPYYLGTLIRLLVLARCRKPRIHSGLRCHN